MKKYLLPEKANQYKANMHCHSTVSDGKLTPLQIKEAYKANGYSIVAYTDHDVLLGHTELRDDDFLPLHGYEMEFTETDDKPTSFKKTCHLCLVALEPDNLTQVCYHRTKYAIGNGGSYRDRIVFDESEPDFEREHDPDIINNAIKKARDAGFFVTYNHPCWSLENYGDYSRYENLNAMEIYNNSCIVGGFYDYNEKEYDEMLRDGKRLFCVGGDDNHDSKPFESRRNDSFGAFTVVLAEKLEYKAVADALLSGNFYASMGPEIRELWYEDGFIHVTTSDADRIVMHTARRSTFIEYAENGAVLNHACFEVKPEFGYVRISVFDKNCKAANTNAYFVDELIK